MLTTLFQSGITITAEQGVTLIDGATISPGVTITSSGVTGNCSGIVNPISTSAVTSFCQSSSYDKTARDASVAGRAAIMAEDPAFGEPEEQGLVVYPNSTEGLLTIKVNSEMVDSKIVLINMDGAVLEERELKSPQSEMDIRHLQSGLYILQVIHENGVYEEKIIKQ